MNQNRRIRIVLGLAVAITLAGARTEKIWTETFGHLDMTPTRLSEPRPEGEPFDPARVPQSGGMASRLLAGLKVKLV
jgi:hypothetical protein